MNLFGIFKTRSFPYQYQFPEIVVKRWKAKHPGFSEHQYKQAQYALLQYFEVLFHNKTTVAMVSEVVDDLWHEFILHTKEYHKFCKNTFGKYIHHHPNEGSVVYKWENKDIPQDMLNLYKLAGNSPYNANAIPLIFTIDEIFKIKSGYSFNFERIKKQITAPQQSKSSCGGSGCSSCGGCD